MKHSFLLGAIFCSLIIMTSCNGGNKNNDFDDDNDDNTQQIELIEFEQLGEIANICKAEGHPCSRGVLQTDLWYLLW